MNGSGRGSEVVRIRSEALLAGLRLRSLSVTAADADIQMTRRKAFPAILRPRDLPTETD
jgi:hypothetical protein